MKQAQFLTPRGVILRRWRVTLPDGRGVYTWAQTYTGAIVKCLHHRGVRPLTVEPAPAEVNMIVRDAFQD